MSLSSSLDGAKPLVLVTAAMFKLLAENMSKLQLAREHSGKIKAEEMAGAGNDLPAPPAQYVNYAASVPIGSSNVPLNAMLTSGEDEQQREQAAEQKPLASVNPVKREPDLASEVRRNSIPVWPGHPWYYVASHPSDSESD